jgi:hypothetical protein
VRFDVLFTSASPCAARYDRRHALRWLRDQRRRPAGLYLGTMSVLSQLAALLDRRLEVGFVRPPVNDPAIGTEVLIREPLVAALPRNRRLVSKGRVPLSTLVDELYVLVQRENGARVPWGGAQGLSWGGLCTARSPRSRSSSDRHGYGRGRQRRVASAGALERSQSIAWCIGLCTQVHRTSSLCRLAKGEAVRTQ